MKIICKNPLLEYTKKIQYPTPGYTYIGESLEELNINEKNNLINEINLFLKPKIISKKKIELKIK